MKRPKPAPGWHPIPEPGGPPARPLADSLEAVARNLGGAGGPALVYLLGRWPAVVGEQLAAHCVPVSLRNGTLTIAAYESAWGAQLGWLEAELLRRLDDAIGAGVVTRIAVRIRPR
jgi:predicted nucleic acid-binding Zn ribbon protein